MIMTIIANTLEATTQTDQWQDSLPSYTYDHLRATIPMNKQQGHHTSTVTVIDVWGFT